MGRSVRWRQAGQLLLLTLACFLAAWSGLAWADRDTATLPFWPAAGIALYGVRRLGLRSAGAVAAALVPAFVLRGVPLAPALIIAIGNAVAAAIGARWMLRRMPRPGTGGLPLLGELLVVMAGASLIAALAGVAGALFWIPADDTQALLRVVVGGFLGHYAGVVVLAPFLNSWLRPRRPDARPMPLFAKLHLTALLVAIALLCGPLFFVSTDWPTIRTWHIYPLLIWAALAFRSRGASAAMLVVSVAAVSGAIEHMGPFGPPSGPVWNSVLMAQQFIILTGLILLLIAEVADERRALGAVRAARQRFEFALDAAGMVGWEFNSETQRIRSFGATETFYGRAVETRDDLEAAIHPEDRAAALNAASEAMRSGNRSYELDYRIVLPSGEVRHVLARGQAVSPEGASLLLFGIAMDVTARRRDEERQALLMAELDHRVKNILATIQALISRTATDKASVPELAETLKGRIQAMARAHSMLARNRWEGASLRGLLEDEFNPYGHDRVALLGPDVQLNPRAALSLSLILHELATNAAKYGALSKAEGKAAIGWAIEARAGGPALVLEWIERGGPPIAAPPARQGFGSVMAGRVVRHEFGGTIDNEFAPEGLTVRVSLPLDRVGQAGTTPGRVERPAAQAPAVTPGDLAGRRILIVEDSPLIADMTAIMLQAAGVEVIGPFAGLRAATASVEASVPEAALLDVNLGDEMVFPLADRLAALGVPFAFATGYGNDTMIPARFRDRPRLLKPFGEQALIAMTGQLLAAKGTG